MLANSLRSNNARFVTISLSADNLLSTPKIILHKNFKIVNYSHLLPIANIACSRLEKLTDDYSELESKIYKRILNL